MVGWLIERASEGLRAQAVIGMENTRLITLAENAERKEFLLSEIDAIPWRSPQSRPQRRPPGNVPEGATLDLAVDALGRIGRVLLQIRRCVAGRERWIRTCPPVRPALKSGQVGRLLSALHASETEKKRQARPAAFHGLTRIDRPGC